MNRSDDQENRDRRDENVNGGVNLATVVALGLLALAVIYFLYASAIEAANEEVEPADPDPTVYGPNKLPRPRPCGSKNKREERMRAHLVNLFGMEFPSVRLPLLTNDLPGQRTGRKCEVDAQNPILNLWAEHHGKQHDPPEFEYQPGEEPLTRENRFDWQLWDRYMGREQTARSKRNHFNHDVAKIRKALERDEMKEIRAAENNIDFIIVWWDEDIEESVNRQIPARLRPLAELPPLVSA